MSAAGRLLRKPGVLASGAVVGSDDFNRATLNSLDTGQTWLVGNGVPTINGNAFAGSTTSEPGDIAYADFGISDARLTLTVTSVTSANGSSAGPVFRWVDANNFWRGAILRTGSGFRLFLQRCLSGTFTTPILVAGDAVAGDIVECLFVGAQIKMYLNGTQQGSTQTDSTHQAATRHGLYSAVDSAWKLDTWRLAVP